MSKMSLTGKWLVKSIYAVSFNQNAGNVNLWELDLVDNGGDLHGIGTNILEVIIVNEQTEIEGFFDDNFLSFVRKYQHTYSTDENGEVQIIENKSYEVNYEGAYNKTLECFHGIWVIARGHYQFDGTFEMKRKTQ
jgi:hypothetical protein